MLPRGSDERLAAGQPTGAPGRESENAVSGEGSRPPAGRKDASPPGRVPWTQGPLAPAQLRLGLWLLEEDRPEEARVALQGAEPRNLVALAPASVPLYHWALAYSSWLVGRWGGATIEVQDGLAAAEEAGGEPHGTALAGVGVVIAVHRGDLVAARALLSRVQRQLLADPSPCPLWSQGAEALLMEAEGQPEGALKVMADGWDRSGPVRHLSGYRLFGPELVRLALLVGDRRRAAAVVGDVEEAGAHLNAPGARGAALRCRGIMEDDPRILLQAVNVLREVSRPLELASACEAAATSLRRAGRESLATSLVHQAITAYQSLGAGRDLARLAGLTTSGHSHVVAARTQETSSAGRGTGRGGDDLTVREIEVLELLAEGVSSRAMAQRLFLSPNTVRNHAQSILRKLRVHSRLEAVSVALRQGLIQPPGAPIPSRYRVDQDGDGSPRR